MALVFLGKERNVLVADNLAMSTTEDKLTARERAQRKDAFAFGTCLLDDYICDHGGSLTSSSLEEGLTLL
jgi:hypothetical protein